MFCVVVILYENKLELYFTLLGTLGSQVSIEPILSNVNKLLALIQASPKSQLVYSNRTAKVDVHSDLDVKKPLS